MMGSQPVDGSRDRRLICIHGHFYQPPRQNPWLGALEREPSASPFHDWNERINFECYRANAYARISGVGGGISRIVNNYEFMSFDFGPALLDWVEKQAPETYEKIIEGDRRSCARNSGHGNAVGHIYNHVIMPLATREDKVTQVLWGIADFSRRFQRYPEGMWLSETAADTETLDVLAQEGIRFTILCPRQALRWREGGEDNWRPAIEQPIPVTRPYRVCLPEGREIAVFFYDGAMAQDIAFGGLLSDGEQWIGRIMDRLGQEYCWPAVLTIATDGESYGHHHKFGDVTLAYVLTAMAERGLAEPTSLAAYLDHSPPSAEVEIVEPSSWSCAHGVERWRSNCGCSTGVPGWNQEWRRPLREAMDFLRAEIDPLYEQATQGLFHDHWGARDRYASVVIGNDHQGVGDFLAGEQRRELNADEQAGALRALEMQRYGQLMFTSCGWFFDDLAGHETGLVLRYAARAIELAGSLGGDPERGFLERLVAASSNQPEMGTGGDAYERQVTASRCSMSRIAAHHGLSSLLREEVCEDDIYCYKVCVRHVHWEKSGASSLVLEMVEVGSKITLEKESVLLVAANLAGSGLRCGLTRGATAGAEFHRAKEALHRAFCVRDAGKIEAEIEALFAERYDGIEALLPDLRSSFLSSVAERKLEWTKDFHDWLLHNGSFVSAELDQLSPAYGQAARALLRYELGRCLKEEAARGSVKSGFARLAQRVKQGQMWGVTPDPADAKEALGMAIASLRTGLAEASPIQACRLIEDLTETARCCEAKDSLWRLQNNYWALLQETVAGGLAGDPRQRDLAERLARLAEALGFDPSVVTSI